MGKKRNKKPQVPRFQPPRYKWVPKSRPATVETRNWLELPRDVTVSILSRLGAVGILWSAQYVCMAWRQICKDPLMWRTIDMRNDGDLDDVMFNLDLMCRCAVDRSAGNLVDLNVEYFGSDCLLNFITDRCRGIKRLRFTYCYGITDGGLSEMASKLPLLEELEISLCDNLSSKSVEAVGRSCPRLKSLKLNREWFRFPDDMFDYSNDEDDDYFDDGDYDYPVIDDQNGSSAIGPSRKDTEALAIAGTMHGLRHLQLFGNQLTSDGLKAILDSCPHLESLDVRNCFNLNLKGDVEKRCADRVKNLRLPFDSTKDYEFYATAYIGDGTPFGDFDESEFFRYRDYLDDEDDFDDDYDYDEASYFSDDSDWYDGFTKIRISDMLF
ncbi:hypothetical protein ACFX1W_036496 [Malus domestica]